MDEHASTFGLISVIMAAYNAEKTIRQAVLSALGQTYNQIELVVVDDCSLDLTVEIVREIAKDDPRIKIFRNESNRGVSFTRKRALIESAGNWIAILDSDDIWRKEKLEKQIKLQKEKEADLIFTGSGFIDEEGSPIDWYLHAPAEIGYRELLKQNLISNSSVLVRRELYSRFYAEDDKMHEDFATWLGIIKAGYKAYGIDEPLLIYRLSKSSKSGNKMNAAKMNWNTYRHIGLNPLESAYYMMWYTVNGIKKYRHLNTCISDNSDHGGQAGFHQDI